MVNRSLLFVPAKTKMLNKINSFSADMYIIDLEDSISEFEKNEALMALINWLENYIDKSKIIVRLNKNNYLREIELLRQYKLDYMLPKFESINDYDLENEFFKDSKIYALVETPLGIININEIVRSEKIYAIAFGAEDYTSIVGMENDNKILIYQKSRLINYSKAYHKLIYDTPSFEINDYDVLKKDIYRSREMGFDGKLCINPKQVNFVNEAFNDIDLEYIEFVVKQYESNNEAVQVINGKVYETMHIKHLKNIIKERRS